MYLLRSAISQLGECHSWWWWFIYSEGQLTGSWRQWLPDFTVKPIVECWAVGLPPLLLTNIQPTHCPVQLCCCWTLVAIGNY